MTKTIVYLATGHNCIMQSKSIQLVKIPIGCSSAHP